MNGALSPDDLRLLRKQFTGNPAYRIAQNAVTQVSIDDVALNRDVVNSMDHSVSHLIDDWKVTNQRKSGRCWLFAGLNLLRAGAMATMNVKEFEFSQNYLFFWDKVEGANYFLEAIIETADRDVDDRTVAHLLENLVDDGGQWNMFVALVRKHGLVPQYVMPDTKSCTESGRMVAALRQVLREGARTLRELHGSDAERIRGAKQEILAVVYRILCMHLGTPPDQFDWQWVDKDREFHRDGALTPLEFAGKYVTLPLDEYVCLVHDPRESSPFGRTFSVEYLGNVVDGPQVVYLNVELDVLKDIAKRTVMSGEPVWFGCDVGKQLRNDLGLWDARLLDYESVYDTTFRLDKAARLIYHETLMTHAMLFTGVDVVDGAARRWRVENSWGDEHGKDGFYTMNDSWFDEHVFEISARRSMLPPELSAALDTKPIVLPAWDPMGSLAR